jgi:FtsP/CotA-like multicopper oxidase with cupredoxin domain
VITFVLIALSYGSEFFTRDQFDKIDISARYHGPLLAKSIVVTEAGENAPPVDLSLERRLEAVVPLAPRAPDVTHRVILAGAMAPYAWSLNGQYWPNVTPLMIAPGQRVAIEMLNCTMMAHPMHLHGHAFQVVAINGAPLTGAVRDTVLVPPMGSVTIAFDADNPDRWAFHCHNLYHKMTGMMTEVRSPRNRLSFSPIFSCISAPRKVPASSAGTSPRNVGIIWIERSDHRTVLGEIRTSALRVLR